MKPIIRAPNEVLTTPTQTVDHFDKKLESLVLDMKKTLLATKRPKGVGLAANQVGVPYRLFITKPTAKAEIRVFINPEIVKEVHTSPGSEPEKKEEGKLEGCLSIPDIWGHVNRASEITIRYQDITGDKHEEIITGFLAHVVQHETDHTNGILFSQRVAEQKEKFYRSW